MVWILLIFSVLCFTLPFYIPSLWPLIFLFPPFLFNALIQFPSNMMLLTWSVAVSTLHLFPLSIALIAMAEGPILLKLIPPLLLIIYVSLWPFALLSSSTVFFKYIPSYESRLIIWTLSLWLYFLIMEHAFLWPLGRLEGYLFFNPLLPLATIPALLAPLAYAPLSFILLWFCCITSTICLCFKQKKYILALCLFIIPWLLLSLSIPEERPSRRVFANSR